MSEENTTQSTGIPDFVVTEGMRKILGNRISFANSRVVAEDLDAKINDVVNFDLLSQCPTWMMLYPNRAEFIGAYLKLANEVNIFTRLMFGYMRYGSPLTRSFSSHYHTGKSLVKILTIIKILTTEIGKLTKDSGLTELGFNINDILYPNVQLQARRLMAIEGSKTLLDSTYLAITNPECIVVSDEIMRGVDGEFLNGDEMANVGSRIWFMTNSQNSPYINSQNNPYPMWVYNLLQDILYSYRSIEYMVKGTTLFDLTMFECLNRRLVDKILIMERIFNIDPSTENNTRPFKAQGRSRKTARSVLAVVAISQALLSGN